MTALQDARRRLLRAAYYPFEDVVSDHVNHPVTVSAFYNILGSAPAIPSKTAENALQCEGLLPSLLPFQRRSVAWLLEREGMVLTPEGTLVPQPSPEAFSFWQQIEEGNHTWYMNRLSAELSEEAPELPNVHGGMLAEEPGLGKTVETIALILMNPALPDWNPTLSRWDDVSCLDVKAVKVCFVYYAYYPTSYYFIVHSHRHTALAGVAMARRAEGTCAVPESPRLRRMDQGQSPDRQERARKNNASRR